MRYLLASIVIITSTVLTAQLDIRPTIGASYTNETRTDFLSFTDYALRNKVSVYGGVRFAEYFCLNIGIGAALGPIPVYPESEKQIQVLTNSLSLSYRILKTKHLLSPMFVTTFGYELVSNAKGKYISHSYIVQTIGQSDFVSYDRMVYFGNVALMLDAEYKNMSLRAGICFNYSRFSYYDVNDYFYSNFYYKSFGIEAGVMYTFPMKKRAAKAESSGG